MESQLVAYIDESSAMRSKNRQDYMVCAAIIDSVNSDAIRTELLPLRLPGQIKLHWTDERESRRRTIVKTLSTIDSMQAVITHRSEISKKTERYRRKCLENMYFELSNMGVQQVVLESRQVAQNKKDIEHIVALQGRGEASKIRIVHIRGGDEPLLWIPDIFLGAINSSYLGNDLYWKQLQDRVVLNSLTPESL